MVTCALCHKEFVGEIELDIHLTVFHKLDAQASCSRDNLKRKAISNDDCVESKKG